MRRALAVVCAAVMVLGTASIVHADASDYVGRPVRAVSCAVDGRQVTDAKLLALIETAVGDPLSLAQVRSSIAHLFSLGRFQDVRVVADARGDGVSLAYELVPIRTVSGLIFSNARGPGIDRSRLRDTVAERFGTSPQPGRVAEVARFLEEQLRLVGYLRGHVTGRVSVEPTGRALLVFDFVPGDRARVAAIEVDGDSGMPVSDFLRQIGLSKGAPFEREVINARIDRYIERRRDRGYYAARVSIVPRFEDDDRAVAVMVSVALGPRTRIEFTGDPLPSDRRDELVPIVREGSTDEDLLEDATNRIESYLRSLGYRDATAPHTSEQVNAEQIITFNVKRGPLYRVGEIELTGNASIAPATLQSRLRVRSGQPFSAAALEADLAALDDLYHREGFAVVQTDLTTDVGPMTLESPDVLIGVKIAVTEGVRTLVSAVAFEGNASLDETALRAELGLQPGRPFFATQMALDRDALELYYANHGFPAAVVVGNPRLNADGGEAVVTYTVREGPRVFIDHVLIVGNEKIQDRAILNELQFKPGDPMGLAAINESQRRLTALGLFRRARITSLEHGDTTRRDILITVDEAPLTTIRYGGGFEVRPALTDENQAVAAQTLQFAPRASFEFGRRNLFGSNRSLNVFTSTSLVPEKPSADQDAPGGGGVPGFPEYRIIGQFREPRVFGGAMDFRVTGTVEQQSRTSFDFASRSASAELGGRIAPTISVSGGYQIQRSRVFNQTVDENEQRTIDRILPNVRLSFFSGSIVRDTRDDQVNPGTGRYLSANASLAARAIGSEVGFAKSFFTAQAFRTVTGARVVLAAAGRLGLATAFSGATAGEGEADLPASERFYAGGDTTVRGFALDQLGVRHSPPLPSDTLDSANFPLGGNGLVIVNGEARVPLRGGLGLVGFMDVGNVFKSPSDIAFSELRAGIGFGVRYRSPIGPIRVDLGFKVRPRDFGDAGRESATALHISLGQAF